LSAATATPSPAAADVSSIGTRVRALRDAMGLSLRDLADRTGVSAPMLSQVERGETSPTLAVATRIAGGLELSLSQLLRLDESGHVVVIRDGEGRTRRRGGHSVDELTPALPGQRADVSLHALDPGAATGGPGDPPIHEPGSRETVYVESGSVVLAIDGDEHELGEGDSVTFDADLSHHFHNRGGRPARFVAVVAAGLRRS
jgi:XRE family transcriptional regulator, regulator of sulfur utilization